MKAGWRSRFPLFLAVGLVAAVASIGRLAAQVAESQPTPPAASQPAEAAGEQSLSGLLGGKHDFTQGGKSGRDLCLPCHTPHLLTTPPPRLDRRAESTPPLRPYQGREVQMTGWSLLCLGCHDGVTAPDVYTSAHALTATGPEVRAAFGSRGLRSHPVGIKYPPAVEGYSPAAAVEAGGLPLPDGRIQCTTCHDAHNSQRLRGMLRISNERSRLCLTCHRL